MKIRYYVFCILASILVAACSTGDEVSVLPKDKVIGVETEVADAVASRAQVTADTLKLKIGFGMYVISSNPNYCYNNYKWIWQRSGTGSEATTKGSWYSTKIIDGFSPMDEKMEWEDDKTPVNIIAYSPFGSNTVRDAQRVNLVLQGVIIDHDYLYAQSQVTPSGKQNTDNDIYYNTATEKLVIKFKHRMSKLNLTLNLGTEFNAKDNGNATEVNPVSTDTPLNLFGPISIGMWNLSTDEITFPTDEDGMRVSWIKNSIFDNCIHYAKGVGTSKGGIARYEFVVLPQTVTKDKLKISFYINGLRYVWKADRDLTFERGKLYNLMLNVGNVVTTGGWSVTDWNENSSTDITMQKE